MVQLDSCCGCCSVKTGSIIVAVLEILSNLLLFVCGIIAIDQPQTKSMGLGFIFYSLVQIIFNSLQIYGALKKMKNYMLPSIILRFIILGLNIIGMLIGFFAVEMFMSFINSNNDHESIPEDVITKVQIGLGILFLLAITLGIYLALIPLSYYNQLQFEENQPYIAFDNINSRSTYENTPPKYNP